MAAIVVLTSFKILNLQKLLSFIQLNLFTELLRLLATAVH